MIPGEDGRAIFMLLKASYRSSMAELGQTLTYGYG
jgi:hypothetical protein